MNKSSFKFDVLKIFIEIVNEVHALEGSGHKRLILVFGEQPQ